MSAAAFNALSDGAKAHRAYQAVYAAMNAQALRPDPDGAGLALEHALELLAPHVSRVVLVGPPVLQPGALDVFDQLAALPAAAAPGADDGAIADAEDDPDMAEREPLPYAAERELMCIRHIVGLATFATEARRVLGEIDVIASGMPHVALGLNTIKARCQCSEYPDTAAMVLDDVYDRLGALVGAGGDR